VRTVNGTTWSPEYLVVSEISVRHTRDRKPAVTMKMMDEAGGGS
jgi:hypothetical protein